MNSAAFVTAGQSEVFVRVPDCRVPAFGRGFKETGAASDDLVMPLPPFTFHPTTTYNAPQKPVILLLPTGGVCEFTNLDNAQSYLNNALRVGAPGADEAALFSFDFDIGEWKRVV